MSLFKRKTGTAGAIILLILAVMITVFFFFSRSGSKQRVSVSKNAIGMGTAVSFTVYGEQGRFSLQERKDRLSGLASGILTSIEELDRSVLSWRSKDSEIYHFNHLDDAGTMDISPELAAVLWESLEIAGDSQGAMDITLRPVIDLWGIEAYDGKTAYIPPSAAGLEEAADSVGFEHLTLVHEPAGENRLGKDIPGLSLDLGAVGKGYALDKAAEMLSGTDAHGAVLAAGGSILIYGDKGEPWQIGIRDPEGSPADTAGILSVSGESGMKTFLSTSGGYEKYVEYQGRILEHIIDGRTLHPAETGLYSVTVITKDSGLASDGLWTACYILGMEDSMPLLKKWRAEAVFITRDKKVWLTNGLADAFSLTNSGYTLAGIR